jgi:DNA-binding MarR family transcriptional regulator
VASGSNRSNDRSDNNLGFLVADVARLMRRAFQDRLSGSSLTLTLTLAQGRALVYVSRNQGIRQVDLADLLEVQPMTLARLVDQLADAGLVERRPDPLDRRAHRIYPTAEASPHLAAIDDVVVEIRKAASRGLDRTELAAVLAALRRMRSNLSDREP